MPNLHPELLIPINGIDVMSIVEFFGIYRFKKISASKNINNILIANFSLATLATYEIFY